MRSSFRVGRVLGFPVDVHVSLLIFLAAVLLLGGGLAGVVLMGLTFASVLAHELGHSVVARRLGIPIQGITLYPFGGMARMGAAPPSPADEMVVAAAGPAVSLVLAASFWAGGELSGLPVLHHLGLVNGMLGLFNLLPALPMDGGRIFRAALTRRAGPLAATRTAATVARVVAVLLGLGGLWLNPMLLVIAVLVWTLAGRERRAAEQAHARGIPLDPAPARLSWSVDAAGRVRRRTPGEGPARSPASQMVVEVVSHR